ncbi:MAG: hypothetical protein FWD54_04795 [Endomicrobia bacterium]|nr:hypothetical protein [Endomicrobiia bacterium]MCL2799570.1 hypothetical protein [Endomicrobiia bacterium]
MNNKGTVLVLVIIFVFIFSLLGLISMRMAVSRNADVFTDLHSARTYYAAESALEEAAFKMGLFSLPGTGAPASVKYGIFAPAVAGDHNVYYNSSNGAAVTAKVSYAGGNTWYPLSGNSNFFSYDTSMDPAIEVSVSAVLLSTTNASGGTMGQIDIDDNLKKTLGVFLTGLNGTYTVPRSFFAVDLTGQAITLTVSNTTLTNNRYLDVYIPLSGIKYADGTPTGITFNDFDNSSGSIFDGHQHGGPGLLSGWLTAAVSDLAGVSAFFPLEDRYYSINARARPVGSTSETSLYFDYFVERQVQFDVGILDLFGSVFNSNTYSSGQSGNTTIGGQQFIRLNFDLHKLNLDATLIDSIIDYADKHPDVNRYINVFRGRR